MEIIEIIPRFFYKSLIGLRGFYFKKRMTKKAKIADLSFCFEFQVVVAVVGFLWHS